VSTFGTAHKAERNAGIVSEKLKNEKERATTFNPCKAEDKYFKHNIKKTNYRNTLVLPAQGFFLKLIFVILNPPMADSG
jgi:hypothetical protein